MLPPDARAAIVQIARERRAPVVEAGREAVVWMRNAPLLSPEQKSAPGARIHLRTDARDYGEISLGLAGDHQVANAVVAVRLLETLEALGVPIGPAAIAAGLSDVRWPGRLELRGASGGRGVLIDAAHNPAGASAAASYLKAASPGRLPLVFAVMKDKDADGMLRALLPTASALVLTRAPNARSLDPEALARIARAIEPDLPTTIAPTIKDALDAAWERGPLIVVAGSIFLAGAVIEEIVRS